MTARNRANLLLPCGALFACLFACLIPAGCNSTGASGRSAAAPDPRLGEEGLTGEALEQYRRSYYPPALPESLDWRDNLAYFHYEDRFTVGDRELVRVRQPFQHIGRHGERRSFIYRHLLYNGQRFKPKSWSVFTGDAASQPFSSVETFAQELRDAQTGEVLLPLDMHHIILVPGQGVFVISAKEQVDRLAGYSSSFNIDQLALDALAHFDEHGEPFLNEPIRQLNLQTGELEETNLLWVTDRVLFAIEDGVGSDGQPAPSVTQYQYDANGDVVSRWPNYLHTFALPDLGIQRRTSRDEQGHEVHYLIQDEKILSVHTEPLQVFDTHGGFPEHRSGSVSLSYRDRNNNVRYPLAVPEGDEEGRVQHWEHHVLARQAPGTAPEEDLWTVFWPDGEFALPPNVVGLRPVMVWSAGATWQRPDQVWSPETRAYWLEHYKKPRPVHYWLVRYRMPGEPGYESMEGQAAPQHRWGLAGRTLNVFTGPKFDAIRFHDTEPLSDEAGLGAHAGYGFTPWNDPLLLVQRRGTWVAMPTYLLPYWTDSRMDRDFEPYVLARGQNMSEVASNAQVRQMALLAQAQTNMAAWDRHQAERAAARVQRVQDERFQQAIQHRNWDAVGQMAAWRGGDDLLYYARNAPNPSPAILEQGAMGLADGDANKTYLLNRARQLREAVAERERQRREREEQMRAAAAAAAKPDWSAVFSADWSGGYSGSSGSSGGYSGPSAWDTAIQRNQQSDWSYQRYRQKWHGESD